MVKNLAEALSSRWQCLFGKSVVRGFKTSGNSISQSWRTRYLQCRLAPPGVRKAYRGLRRMIRKLLEPSPAPLIDYFSRVEMPRSCGGRLLVSGHFSSTPFMQPSSPKNPRRYRHTWVANWNYAGMEDNDLRGFLDGRFKFSWNQPSQIHVRLGRLQQEQVLGEWELFRVLHRWGDVRLPPAAIVDRVELQIEIERGLEHEVELFVYLVNKDWNPGLGGELANNNSFPCADEVWWNEVGCTIKSWGLPGVGFASDTHPDADTPTTPLARTLYRPGDRAITFASDQLCDYVQGRATSGAPLLFLLKLGDYFEDTAGSVLHLFSANHGDNRNPSRRPQLTIEWHDDVARDLAVQDLLLEHGRSLELPRINARDCDWVGVSFDAAEGLEAPSIYVRGGKAGTACDWRRVDHPVEVAWDWLQVRLDADQNRARLGVPFEAEFRDTWVQTGPPETQRVPWIFDAPSGSQHEILATYVGDYRWRVCFSPWELGRWRYRWSNQFLAQPYKSAEGTFDVMPEDHTGLAAALEVLKEEVAQCPYPPGEQRVRLFGVRFQRLERAVMRMESPESFRMSDSEADGGTLSQQLDSIRVLLSGGAPVGPRLTLYESAWFRPDWGLRR